MRWQEHDGGREVDLAELEWTLMLVRTQLEEILARGARPVTADWLRTYPEAREEIKSLVAMRILEWESEQNGEDPEDVLAHASATFMDELNAGRLPSIEPWLERYPELAEQIETVYQRVVMLGRAFTGWTGSDEPEIPAALGPYRVLSTVCDHPCGRIFLVERNERHFEALHFKGEGRELLGEAARKGASNPNFVPFVHELELEDAGALIWEHVSGHSLADILQTLRRGEEPSSSEQRRVGVVRLVGRVLDSLSAIHDAGLVHLGICPDSVLVGGSLVFPRLRWAGLLGASFSAQRQALPAEMEVFLAPEVACGAEAGVAADIYGVGGLLHALLSFTPPVDGEDGTRNYPKALTEILQQALARDPEERFASARDFADALSATLDGE